LETRPKCKEKDQSHKTKTTVAMCKTMTAICQITDELRDETENTFWQLLKILLFRQY